MAHDEFLFKKMGEVLAFEETGLEALEEHKTLIQGSILADEYDHITRHTKERIDGLQAVARELGGEEAMRTKADKTGEKLRKLREIYLSSPDDFSDILEWFGIHEGGAITHWILVEGEAAQSQSASLKKLVVKGVAGHELLFALFTGAIRQLGEEA